MCRSGEHVDGAGANDVIAVLLKDLQVADQAGRFAGNVDHVLDAVGDDLLEGLRVNAVTRWIQDDEIWTLLELIQFLQNVARDEGAVIQMVADRIFPGGFDRLLHDLDADDMASHRGQHLGNGSRSAV